MEVVNLKRINSVNSLLLFYDKNFSSQLNYNEPIKDLTKNIYGSHGNSICYNYQEGHICVKNQGYYKFSWCFNIMNTQVFASNINLTLISQDSNNMTSLFTSGNSNTFYNQSVNVSGEIILFCYPNNIYSLINTSNINQESEIPVAILPTNNMPTTTFVSSGGWFNISSF